MIICDCVGSSVVVPRQLFLKYGVGTYTFMTIEFDVIHYKIIITNEYTFFIVVIQIFTIA